MNPLRTSLSLAGAAPLLAAVVLLLAPACSSTRTLAYSTPEEATAAMITAAGAGDIELAGEIFDSLADEPLQRDRMYVALFDAASERYKANRSAEAANVLTFVTERYPQAASAREALVYALFLERAAAGKATEASTSAMKSAIGAVRADVDNAPTWVDLAETQAAIDDGDLDRARETFDAFLVGWDQAPADLVVYVEDLDRYLESH